MNSDYKKIKSSLQGRKYAPVYLIDGEETYYLDLITQHFEEDILAANERDFNLMVLYGRDVQWTDVVNSCRRFPMFADRQVVIVKDAAQLKDINELSAYVENPSPTTVLLLEHRFKKTDGRGRLLKLVKEKGLYFNSEKIKDELLPGWIIDYGVETGFHILEPEARMLAANLGNDLQKIVNEVEKVRINVPTETTLNMELIKKYIGISREYNIFEFPEALTSGDKDKLYKMLAYFSANPKSAPMPLVIGTFYSHFSKLYQAHFIQGKNEKEAAAALGMWTGKKFNEIMATTRHWPLPAIENCLLILGQYNNKSVGIKSNTDGSELLKEMMGKLMN